MVQLFLSMGMSEEDAFLAFADLYPDDCILLVDTINTLESGIPNAIKIFQALKKKGHKPLGIRLDSGDLAYLSLRAAKMLNDAGLEDVGIVLSNELDEMNIWQIITQISEEASKYGLDADRVIHRLIYGVGTRLITSAGDSALGGVYKLVAVKDKGEWQPALKISESLEKIPNPGDKKVWRIYDKSGKATADLITLSDENPQEEYEIVLRNPLDHTKKRIIRKDNISKIEPLLYDIIVDGKLIYEFPSIEEIRKLKNKDLESLDSGIKRLILPHPYHVSISKKLWDVKQGLIKNISEPNNQE
jgi:nicotinate phosphoribosyltransferase